MNYRKILALAVVLLIAPMIWGRNLGDDAPMTSRASSGDVTITGALVMIPGIAGSAQVTYSVIVANDSSTDVLLAATDVVAADATAIPTPPNDITTMSKVIRILPGEKLSLDQGAQSVGLRAVSGTIPARVIVTFK